MPTQATEAILFPGQGSQAPGMRETVERERPDLLALATELVGEDPFPRVADGTRFAQPAIYCASLAHWERLGRPPGDLLAGHSLGEVAALVAGGAISAEDGTRVVAARGWLMHEAARAGGEGGMLAARTTPDVAGPLAERLGVVMANVNDPQQVVLSGPRAGLDEAAGELAGAGVRTKLLPVAGAFHSPAIAGAVPGFRALLDEIEVAEPRAPVLRCATATPFADVREELAASLTSPVLWLGVMRELRARGARRFLEPGPGRVLSGLVRRSLEGVEVVAGEDLEAARV